MAPPWGAGGEPPQVYGSNQKELAWTVVPVLIVIVLFLATAPYIFGIEGFEPTPSALQVTIIGHQWWWEIRYPDLGIVTANELHVPVSDPADRMPLKLQGALSSRTSSAATATALAVREAGGDRRLMGWERASRVTNSSGKCCRAAAICQPMART
jgi:hypothetical protein